MPHIPTPDECTPGWWIHGGSVLLVCKSLVGLHLLVAELCAWGWHLLGSEPGCIADSIASSAADYIKANGAYGLRLDKPKVMGSCSTYWGKELGLTLVSFSDAIAGIRNQECYLAQGGSSPHAAAESSPQGCQHLNKKWCPPISPTDISYEYCPDCKQEI